MTADQVLAMADDLRSFALQLGRDRNAANLFVHTMLVRAIRDESADLEEQDEDESRAA